MNTHYDEEKNYTNYSMMNDMDYHDAWHHDYKHEYEKNYDKSYEKDFEHSHGTMKNKMFDPMTGLHHGNMFPEIYKPYKNEKVFKIEPMNEQAHLLTNIDALQFALLDINQYLDFNPQDKEMIRVFNEYKTDWHRCVMDYEEKFGPLTVLSPVMKQEWSWIEKPWPWEV